MEDIAMSVDAVIEAAVQTHALKVPKIGEPWPGQGGIYAGLTRGEDGGPDCHLILALAEPDKALTWRKGLDWAAAVEVDGLADFHMPSRDESALLYANVRSQFDPDSWYWTGTQYSATYAWVQHFYDGTQYNDGKKYERRVRAVRRFAA